LLHFLLQIIELAFDLVHISFRDKLFLNFLPFITAKLMGFKQCLRLLFGPNITRNSISYILRAIQVRFIHVLAGVAAKPSCLLF
jgi:hypothetical protein